jgi:hypothetical protein
MNRCGAAALLLVLLLGSTASAHAPVPPVQAVRAAGEIHVDGRLDEPAWEVAPPAGDFRQLEPHEGAPATERTELRVLFDDDALYVGARMYDDDPGAIVRRRSRRDDAADADGFSLFLDPNHDHLTAREFRVSAAGVQRDVYVYNDVTEDSSWDAVWASAVSVDTEGWSVEMRIPFSQLRFPQTDRPTWGINAERLVFRKHEWSWLALVPRNVSALASRMAHLDGLPALRQPRHFELRPYLTGRAEYIEPPRAGNPFNDGSRAVAGIGGDAKYGLATNLTLDATVNPDFGQVEVDPAVVNLTAFETFFEEKRPFFFEGSQTFASYGQTGFSSNPAFFRPDPIIFYSRRIGRVPQGTVDGEFVQQPSATTIIGAAKVTGRTRRGWTLSSVEAVTAREHARVANGLDHLEAEVEPLTNYFAARAFKELGSRAGVGFIGTAADRSFDDRRMAATLAGHAWVGGIDGHLFLDERREWVVHGSLASSYLRGDPAAITAVQRAPARYYQRPDAPHVHVDPTATSISGWMGDVALNRNSGNVIVNARLWGNSPGFETNDLGFVTQTDRAGGHGLVLFRRLTPDRVFRVRQLALAKWWTWNYAGECQGDGEQATLNLQFLNYSQLNLTLSNSRKTLDDKLTRGGPTVIRPGIHQIAVSAVSDTRRRLGGQLGGTWALRDYGSWSRTITAALDFRPSPGVTLSVGPRYFDTRNVAQYLRTVVDPTATATYGSRYVFGDLHQTEVSIESRVNVVLSPTVSVQAYVQPLVSVGDYAAVREFAQPRTYDFLTYGRDVGTIVEGDGSPRPDGVLAPFIVDPDGAGPAPPFLLPDPNFNFKSLRLNTILRWEWRPGSTVYLVWTENRANTENPGDFAFGRDLGDLFSSAPDDVVMVKVSWWIGR